MVDKLNQYWLAHELIKRKARISVVHAATDLSKAILRKIYWDINGTHPPQGAIKYSSKGVFDGNATLKKECTVFATVYDCLRSKSDEPCQTRMIINAYDIFTSIRGQAMLDMTGAWVIANDLRLGNARLSRCHACSAAAVVWPVSSVNCLICRTEIFG